MENCNRAQRILASIEFLKICRAYVLPVNTQNGTGRGNEGKLHPVGAQHTTSWDTLQSTANTYMAEV